MECISYNPFRVLGLYADASERDLQKNRAKISAYLDAKKEILFEQDFSFLQPIQRSTDLLDKSISALESDSDKLIHSLFWFVKGSHVDETALENLKAGNDEKAIEIWEKVAANEDQWQHHYTVLNNLSTLQLSKSIQADVINLDTLSRAINLKLKLISSNVFSQFIGRTVGSRYSTDADDTSLEFTERLLSSIDKHLEQNKINIAEVYAAFSTTSEAVRTKAQDHLSKKPIQRLTNLLLEIKQKRKADASQPILADRLVRIGHKDLTDLKRLLGVSDIQYQNITDKFAGEILQIAIDYFHANENSGESDPTIDALPMMEKAKKYAVGNLLKQRIDKNISDLKEWQEEKPERDRYNRVSDSVKKLMDMTKSFQKKSPRVTNGMYLAIQSRDLLSNIRNVLGKTDDLYIKISSTIVNNALEMAITAYNLWQDRIKQLQQGVIKGTSTSMVDEMKDSEKIGDLIRMLFEFDVDTETKRRLEINKATINKNTNFSGQGTPTIIENPTHVEYGTTPAKKDSNSGCWWLVLGFVLVMAMMGQCGGNN